MRLSLVPMSLAAILAAACPMAAQPAHPQGPGKGNPAGTPAGTHEAAPGAPAPRQLNQADRKFLQAALAGGTAEVEFAKLAQRMTKNTGINDFARRMVREHQEANKRIGTFARDAGLPPMQRLDGEHQALYDRLSKLQGGAFDRGYIDGQIVDHQVMAQLLEYEIGSGQDKELKALAAELLPAVLDHLRTADAVLERLSRSAAK